MLFNRALQSSTAAVQVSRTKTFPAPRRGLIRNDAYAAPQGEGAEVMDNWLPTPQGARLRKGSLTHATIGEGVRALMVYETGAVRKMFVASDEAIFDVTTPVDPNTAPAASVSGMLSGAWSAQQFSNSAGNSSLIAVNGMDDLRRFDGAAWTAINAASMPISITGVPTNQLSQVWSHQNRLFFVQRGTMSAWYLPTLSFGGGAQELPMGSNFTKGGTLLFGTTWSTDSGAGMDDLCVFVSDMGEVVVFQGTDPASADTWQKVGTYAIGRPLGKTAFFKTGGDVAIITDDGIVSVSQIIQKDRAGLASVAITFPIEGLWREIVAQRGSSGYDFQAAVLPTESIVLVSIPTFAGLDRISLVANAKTGAWCRYTGWDTRCICVFGDGLYFGTSDGKVKRAEVGGSDDGLVYAGVVLPRFDDMASPAWKCALHARATLLSKFDIQPLMFGAADFDTAAPVGAVTASNANAGSVWGGAVWGASKWGGVAPRKYASAWQGVAASGTFLSAGCVVASGTDATPDIELVSIHLQYETGSGL